MKILILFLCAILFSSTSNAQTTQISSCSELSNLISSSGTFELKKDIDMTSCNPWSGISSFSGSLDGKGFKISNMSMTVTSNIKGLFNTLTSSAIVRNLTISSSTITITTANTETVGFLAGKNQGTIRDCKSIFNTFDFSNKNHKSVGGLVGDHSGTIDNCITHSIRFINVASTYGTVSIGFNIGLVSGVSTITYLYSFNNSIVSNLQVGGNIGRLTINNLNSVFTIENLFSFSNNMTGNTIGGNIGYYDCMGPTVDLELNKFYSSNNILTVVGFGDLGGNIGFASNSNNNKRFTLSNMVSCSNQFFKEGAANPDAGGIASFVGTVGDLYSNNFISSGNNFTDISGAQFMKNANPKSYVNCEANNNRITINGSPSTFTESSTCTGTTTSPKLYCPDIIQLSDTLNPKCCSGDCCDTSTCTIRPNTYVCRESNGDCDAAEKCDGTTTTCPADQVANSTTICRPVNGQCDVAEVCDGTTKTCPTDKFEPNTTSCSGTSNGGICDASVDYCSGTSGACLDKFKSNQTLCRKSKGQCDVEEKCDGLKGSCPPDKFQSNTTKCTGTSNGGVCDDDSNDKCTGTSNDCVDAFKPSTFICRSSKANCDPAEYCSGKGSLCPVDRKTCKKSLGKVELN